MTLCADDQPAEIADQFEAHVIWMDDHKMLPGRPYVIKLGTPLVTATFSPPKYKVNVNTHGAPRRSDSGTQRDRCLHRDH